MHPCQEQREREREREFFLFWCNFLKNANIKRNLRSYRYFLHFLHFFSFFLSFMSDLVTIELSHLHEYKGGICQGYAVFRRQSLHLGTIYFGFCNNKMSIFVLFWTLDGNSWETGFYSRFVLGTEIQRSVKTNGTKLGPTDAQTVDLHLDSYSNLFLKLLENLRFLATCNFIVFITAHPVMDSPYIISSQNVLVKIPIFHPDSNWGPRFWYLVQ